MRHVLETHGLSSSSAKRIFGSVRAITRLILSEHGLDLKNPFTGTYLPDKADARIREPIPLTVIRHIQQVREQAAFAFLPYWNRLPSHRWG
jgi:hypothetical protein